MPTIEQLEFRAPREEEILDLIEGMLTHFLLTIVTYILFYLDMSQDPNPYAHLGSIKINPNITAEDDQRILDLLKYGVKPPKVEKESDNSVEADDDDAEIEEEEDVPSDLDHIPDSQHYKRKHSPPPPSSKRSSQQDQVSSSSSVSSFAKLQPPVPSYSSSSNRSMSPPAIKEQSSPLEMVPPGDDGDQPRVFEVLYGKYKPNKKHKNWTNDGYVKVFKSGQVILYDDKGNK